MRHTSPQPVHIDRIICTAGKIIALVLLLPVSWGCDEAPLGAPKKAVSATAEDAGYRSKVRKELLQLSPEKIAQSGIEVEAVVRGMYQDFRDFPGTVEPNRHALADITTLVRGRVVEVYADLGQEVQAGTLLAVLDSRDLAMAQSTYLKAKAKLYVAERGHERAKALLKGKVIGVAELQRREGEKISVLAESRQLYDHLRLLGMSEGEIAQLEREQTIRSRVSIAAPFHGRVITRNLTKGEVIETDENPFVVADLSQIWVMANIPEKDILFIPRENSSQADNVEVRFSAYPGEIFHGKITYVGDVLDPVTRTMKLRLELPNPHFRLKPGMFASIRVYSEPQNGVIIVPEAAVQHVGQRQFVFVQRDAKSFEVRDVTLDKSNGRLVTILNGLREGERVATRGAFTLKSELLGEQV
jgi:cobalt-zinc-cadmium efflux system membrane fusion protein